MSKELFSLSEKIKSLRNKSELTQAKLSRSLGLTRSSINSWEMGLSVPSTHYIVELAKFFNVSTDYLLGLNSTATIPVDGLSPKQVAALLDMISCFQTVEKFD